MVAHVKCMVAHMKAHEWGGINLDSAVEPRLRGTSDVRLPLGWWGVATTRLSKRMTLCYLMAKHR